MAVIEAQTRCGEQNLASVAEKKPLHLECEQDRRKNCSCERLGRIPRWEVGHQNGDKGRLDRNDQADRYRLHQLAKDISSLGRDSLYLTCLSPMSM
jgi:hypothetical protein